MWFFLHSFCKKCKHCGSLSELFLQQFYSVNFVLFVSLSFRTSFICKLDFLSHLLNYLLWKFLFLFYLSLWRFAQFYFPELLNFPFPLSYLSFFQEHSCFLNVLLFFFNNCLFFWRSSNFIYLSEYNITFFFLILFGLPTLFVFLKCNFFPLSIDFDLCQFS